MPYNHSLHPTKPDVVLRPDHLSTLALKRQTTENIARDVWPAIDHAEVSSQGSLEEHVL